MESIFNWCMKSYPKLMTIEQVDALYNAGKLTEVEYNEVINHVSNI